MNSNDTKQESLNRALFGESTANYSAIVQGFVGKGIAVDDIEPRENIFTFNAWKALGRSVKRGEHGVKIATVIEREKMDPATGAKTKQRIPWNTTVFHISQTEEVKRA